MNGANENCLAESKLYIKNYHLAKVALLLLQPVWTLLSIAQSAGSADCFTPPWGEEQRNFTTNWYQKCPCGSQLEVDQSLLGVWHALLPGVSLKHPFCANLLHIPLAVLKRKKSNGICLPRTSDMNCTILKCRVILNVNSKKLCLQLGVQQLLLELA